MLDAIFSQCGIELPVFDRIKAKQVILINKEGLIGFDSIIHRGCFCTSGFDAALIQMPDL